MTSIGERAEHIARTRGHCSHAHNGHDAYTYTSPTSDLRIHSTTDGWILIYLGRRSAYQRRLTGVCEVYNGLDEELEQALAQEVEI
jgi:hypothetical protein